MDCLIGQDLKCTKCGRPAKFRHLRRHCMASGPPPSVGVGDMVANGLEFVGITKERVQAVAQAVGIKDCGCAKRQQALNEWGQRALGIGGDPPANDRV